MAAESITETSGVAVSSTRCGAASELYARGAEVSDTHQLLRACPAKPAHAPPDTKAAHYSWTGVAYIERKISADERLQQIFADEVAMAKRVLAQKWETCNKLYSLHAREVECISKGKAHNRYEFGVKASIAVTNHSSFVVGEPALPSNPYDDHTLKTASDQVHKLCGQQIEEMYVDRGYRGSGETDSAVYISGQKRGVTDRIRCCLKRRQATDLEIGHLKQDDCLGHNHLKGSEGDSVNVLLSCAGHNLRLILKRLRGQCVRFFLSLSI